MESRARLTLSSSALTHNFRELLRQNRDLPLLPMIKADAYGHGIQWVAKALKTQKGLHGFGVATLEAGTQVRGVIPSGLPVLVFSGAMPFREETARFCKKHNLTPVISSLSDLKRLIRFAPKLPFHLEFNTGMNRLGLCPLESGEAFRLAQPQGVFTHLAESESPVSTLTKKQVRHYRDLVKQARSAHPKVLCHLANSGAIYNFKKLGLGPITDLARPGLSLYGVPPWPGKKTKLRSVAKVEFQVLQTYLLGKGDRVGYGGTFRAPRNEFPIAILGGGYADGVGWYKPPRPALGYFRKKKLPFLGRVSMDLTAIQGSRDLRPGHWVEFLGPNIDAWKQASALGTIPYELLTSMGGRLHRITR